MQYRKRAGEITEEYTSELSAPEFLRIEKRGEIISMFVRNTDTEWIPVGSVNIQVDEPFLVGLAVCSHDDSQLETAKFSELKYQQDHLQDLTLVSRLETFTLETQQRDIIIKEKRLFEASNWAPDNSHFIINSDGLLYRVPHKGGELSKIESGFTDVCNNDHGISPNGEQLAISHHHEMNGNRASRIFVLQFEGGSLSWSPDSRSFAFVSYGFEF